MLHPDYPIRTERLLLRPVGTDDAPALAAYQSRPDVCRYIPYEPRGEDMLRARIADPELARSTLDEPGQAMWVAVVRAEDDVLVGDAILFWTSAEHRSGEVGYVLDPDHHGRGYATETVSALLRLGFGAPPDGLGLHRIVGRIDARNDASGRVLERCGFRKEAYLVDNEWFKGGWSSEIGYGVLEPEWRAGPTR